MNSSRAKSAATAADSTQAETKCRSATRSIVIAQNIAFKSG